MTPVREWMSRRSGPELFVINGVYFGLAMWLFGLASHLHYNLVALTIGGVVFGVGMTALTLYGRKRSGGANFSIAVNTAIRTGELPATYDRAIWLQQLELRLVSLRRSLIMTPITFGIATVCLSGSVFLSTPPTYFVLVFVAVMDVLGAISIVSGRGGIRKILGLQERIRSAYVAPIPTTQESVQEN